MTYQKHLWLMLMPYMIGLIGLVLVPALLSVPLAFTEFDALSPPRSLGPGNFLEMSKDPQFWNGLRASAIVVLVAVPLRVLGALLLALLLQARSAGFALFRGLAYLPTIIPSVAYALVWLYIFNPLYGPLNGLSRVFQSAVETEFMPPGGLPGIWLTDPNAAQVAIITMLLFTVGEGFVLLLAALQEVPRELYDAAAIDGATGFQQTWHITLPTLVPSLLLLSLRDTIFLLEASFVAATIVTQGGPYYATNYLPYWIYTNVTQFQRFGYAAAMAWVLYAVAVGVIGFQFWLTRRWRVTQYA